MDLYFSVPKYLTCKVHVPQGVAVSDVSLSSGQIPFAAHQFIWFRGRKPEGLRHRDVVVGGRGRPRPLESSPEGDGRVAIEAVTH